MNILGLGGAVGHDPASALFVNGELVAAVEEERFIRDKHAKGKAGHEATKFCLNQAGLGPRGYRHRCLPFCADPDIPSRPLALRKALLVCTRPRAHRPLQWQPPLQAQ
jgi:hypothetical protein